MFYSYQGVQYFIFFLAFGSWLPLGCDHGKRFIILSLKGSEFNCLSILLGKYNPSLLI